MTHPLEAVAWTLIHFCWQAVAVAAAYRLVAIALARRTSQTRYLASLSSLLLMLLLAVGTFAWELGSDHHTSMTLAYSSPNSAVPPGADLPRTVAPPMPVSQPENNRLSLGNLLPWIDGLWLAGVFALSIRSLGGWWYLRRLRLSSVVEAPSAVRASFQRISSTLGLHRLVALRLSNAIDSPMTMGTLRAIVLLPLSAVTSLGPDELEVVLAHELAHVRRADFFWNVLQTIAETLFFFHPAVWWINARIRHERELCCDDLALTVCPNPVVYAHALYRLEEHRSRHLRMAMALDGHQSHQTLLTRIARILGEPMTHIPSRRLRPFSLAAACAGLVVLLLPVPHVLASLNPAPKPAPSPSVAVTPVSAPQVAVVPEVSTQVTKPSASPAQIASVAAEPEPTPQAAPQSQDQTEKLSTPHSDYIDSMKAAGYDVDLDKLIALKIQNVTPEYAHAMAQVGLGKPSADDLIACKIQGITPEYIAELKKQGFEIKSLQDAIPYRLFGVTPEFAAGMKSAGFDVDSKQLVSLRVQGITPEYAQKIKKTFPNATVENLLQARIFRIDDAFIAQAKKHGFENLSFDKLVQLRISGLLDDESTKE